MCDPVSIGLTIIGGTMLAQGEQQRKAASQARSQQRETLAAQERERADAEAKAIQSANARLVADNKRRRAQSSLLSTGASATSSMSPISVDTPARGSMMSRGAPSAVFHG